MLRQLETYLPSDYDFLIISNQVCAIAIIILAGKNALPHTNTICTPQKGIHQVSKQWRLGRSRCFHMKFMRLHLCWCSFVEESHTTYQTTQTARTPQTSARMSVWNKDLVFHILNTLSVKCCACHHSYKHNTTWWLFQLEFFDSQSLQMKQLCIMKTKTITRVSSYSVRETMWFAGKRSLRSRWGRRPRHGSYDGFWWIWRRQVEWECMFTRLLDMLSIVNISQDWS